MKKIGVVILNFNGAKDTIDCLNSLYNTDFLGYKLFTVIVDNGSDNNDKVEVKNYIASFKRQIAASGKEMHLTVIENEKNVGFSEGNNIGIRYVLKQGVDYVIILNNDTIVEENCIKKLLKISESDSQIGIVVPKIYFAKGNEFHKDRYREIEKGKVIWYAGGIMDWNNVIGKHRGVDEVDKGQYDKVEQTDFATGCCMMVKKGVFDKVGYFDNRYFLYYEDNDLSNRVRNNGYKIFFVPDAVIWHKNAGTAGGSGSKLQDYYITRNRLLFGFKYGNLRSKLALFRESIKLFASGRKEQTRGIIDFYFGRFGKGSYK